jgi:DNA repair protein RadA/Sms
MKEETVYKEDPVLLNDVKVSNEKRYVTGIAELDRVLGGGIVAGSVTLIGGDPGIGKSTLALQIGCALSKKKSKILYVSGEESVKQTSLRAQRLTDISNQSLYIVNQVDLNVIMDYIRKMKPDVVIIDSIQVVYQPEISSSPGSVSQVRECSALLTHMAKSEGVSMFIIGHVTKDGALAGPRGAKAAKIRPKGVGSVAVFSVRPWPPRASSPGLTPSTLMIKSCKRPGPLNPASRLLCSTPRPWRREAAAWRALRCWM